MFFHQGAPYYSFHHETIINNASAMATKKTVKGSFQSQ